MRDALPLVFDGHNDVLTRLLDADAAETFVSGAATHVDLPKARAGGFGGGFFAVWVASPEGLALDPDAMRQPIYDLPLPRPLAREQAWSVVQAEVAILQRLQSIGAVRICTRVEDIRACLSSNVMAAVLHLEGAEAIDEDMLALEQLHRQGLRSLGPVWSRPTIWAEGVPFRFPGTPDTGKGLTPLGIALVRRCNELGILIDLSHLNEAGFDDIAAHSVHPLVATHSNAHALCRHARNLTDRQLEVIAESGGMVGLNFATAFLRSDGQMRADTAIDTLLRHLDHLIGILGEGGVGFGSDFDGAIIPESIADCAGLTRLRQAMRRHGYDEALMRQLCHENWLSVLERTWHAGADAPRSISARPGDKVDANGDAGVEASSVGKDSDSTGGNAVDEAVDKAGEKACDKVERTRASLDVVS